MSTSVPSTKRATPAKRSRVLRRWVIGISAVLLTLVLFIVIRTQGHVTGQEFAPSHFQLRDFSFYEIPIVHIQITPIKRSGSTPTTAMYVRQNALIKPPTGPPDTWHLVSLSRGITGRTPADPQLLIDQFAIQDQGDAYWRKWSIDHPKRAKTLWPVVQTLAERELYILLPEVFELAQLNQKPAELASKIDDLLKKNYHGLVLDMRAADRQELADLLLTEAIADYPDDPSLRQLLADATEAGGGPVATPSQP